VWGTLAQLKRGSLVGVITVVAEEICEPWNGPGIRVTENRRRTRIAVNDPVAAAEYCFAVAVRGPGKRDARPKVILVCRENVTIRMLGSAEVVDPSWIRDLWVHAGEVEIGKVVVPFAPPAEDIVPKPDVYREISSDTIVVLYIKTPIIICLVGRMVCA